MEPNVRWSGGWAVAGVEDDLAPGDQRRRLWFGKPVKTHGLEAGRGDPEIELLSNWWEFSAARHAWFIKAHKHWSRKEVVGRVGPNSAEQSRVAGVNLGMEACVAGGSRPSCHSEGLAGETSRGLRILTAQNFWRRWRRAGVLCEGWRANRRLANGPYFDVGAIPVRRLGYDVFRQVVASSRFSEGITRTGGFSTPIG